MEILLGNDVVKEITKQIKKDLEDLNGYIPTLAIVRVGENPDDISYERAAIKRFEKLGMNTKAIAYSADVDNVSFVNSFKKINEDESINGILLMRPLPKHIDEDQITNMIDPLKDIDCIGPTNLAKVFASDESGFEPCTAKAVMEMIDYAGIDLRGKRAVVVGRSLVVGKPVSMMLMKKNATITICHTGTKNMEEVCKQGEILVAAAGRAKMINEKHVAKGAYVFDVGINVDEEGNLCGDVDMDSIGHLAALCTPVPRGVGTVTTSVLAKQVVKAAKLQKK